MRTFRSGHLEKSWRCSLYFIQSFLVESLLLSPGGAKLESTGGHALVVDFKVGVMTVFNGAVAPVLFIAEYKSV